MKTGRFAEKTFESNIAKLWKALDLMGFFPLIYPQGRKENGQVGLRGWGEAEAPRPPRALEQGMAF